MFHIPLSPVLCFVFLQSLAEVLLVLLFYEIFNQHLLNLGLGLYEIYGI
jgi:hypothetical protein